MDQAEHSRKEASVNKAIVSSLAIFLVVLAAAPGWGAESGATLGEQAAAVNGTAQTPKGEQVVADRLSQELGMPAAKVQAQREQTKLGWGEILIANRLAQKTGMSFDQVVSEFRSGKGWGKIAQEHNVNLGKLVSEVKESRQSVEAEARRAEKGRASSEDSREKDKGFGQDHPGPGAGGMGMGDRMGRGGRGR